MNAARHAGFSLVEVTIALGVVAFVVVAVLGMMPLGLSTHRESKESQSATLAMSSLTARLRQAIQTDDPRQVMPEINFPAPGDTGVVNLFVDRNDQSLTTSATSTSIYRARIDLIMPSNQDQTCGVGFVHLSWPASSTNLSTTGSVEATIALPSRRTP